MTDSLPIKNVLDVEQRVGVIRNAAHDYEKAHGLEDDLWRDVLLAIAAGAYRPRQLAQAALESRAIAFDRHTA